MVKKLYQIDQVKYLGIDIDKSLFWKHHIDNVAVKLNKANAMLSKIRQYVDMKMVKLICDFIFDPPLFYFSLFWVERLPLPKWLHFL